MKLGNNEEERLREERERERGVLEAQEWSEEGENDEWKFDRESTPVTRVEEFETQATRRKTRQPVHQNGLWCGGGIRGGSVSVTSTARGATRTVEEKDGD